MGMSIDAKVYDIAAELGLKYPEYDLIEDK